MPSTPAWIISAVVGIVIIIAALVYFLPRQASGDCNVAYIPLLGDLVTYIPPSEATTTGNAQDQTGSEDVTQSIRDAAADPSIAAIVLEIDSPGGDPVGGQEIESTLKLADKPTVALIRSEGDSAAYLAATGANTIFASDFSDVGDIGITESYTDQAKQDAANGITFNQLSIGQYKDMYDPDTALTPAERALAMTQLQIMYNEMVGIIAQNRGMSTSSVLALANGASMTGQQALQDGLVDKLGTIDDVRTYLTQKFGTNAVICGIDTN